MDKPRIKFSHAYNKLQFRNMNGAYETTPTARLVLVTSVTYEELGKDFIAYDTDHGKYALAYSTLYLMLIFLKPDGNIFTTLRPQYGPFGNKKKYYQELVGKEFDVIVETRAEAKPPLHSHYHEQAEAQAKIQRDLK